MVLFVIHRVIKNEFHSYITNIFCFVAGTHLTIKMHYIKDRTECFDDYFSCKMKNCKLGYTKLVKSICRSSQ